MDKRQFECNDGEGIYKFEGTFHESKLDRTWTWGCRKVTDSFDHCYWTDYLNGLDQHLNGNCPSQYLLNGVGSYFDSHAKDRKWKIRCCKSDKIAIDYCGPSKINDHYAREKIEYVTEDELSIVSGLESDHDNGKEYACLELSL